MKRLFSLFLLAWFIAVPAFAATGGQYGNYTTPYYYNTYTYIPIVTRDVNGQMSCSVMVDPRVGGYGVTPFVTSNQCWGTGEFVVPGTWFYSQTTAGSQNGLGIMTRNEWYAFYYNRKSMYSPSFGSYRNYGTGAYNNYFYGSRYNSPYSYSYDDPYNLQPVVVQTYPVMEEVPEVIGDAGDFWISGGDFNGDGVGDCMVYDPGSNQIGVSYVDWYEDGSPGLTDEQVFDGGGANTGVFFVNVDGANDWVGFIRRSSSTSGRVKLVNPLNKKSKMLRLSGVSVSSKQLPKPAALGNGRDAMVFYRRTGNNTEVVFKDVKGRTIAKTTLKGRGEVVVGDYTDDAGEEVAVRGNGGFTIFSPISKLKSFVNAPSGGRALDAITYTKIPKI